MSLQGLLEPLVQRHPGKTALVTAQGEVSYATLEAMVKGLAGGLVAHGVQVGDRVAWMLPNGLAAVLISLACYRIRAVSVPVNVRYTQQELSYMISKVGAKLLFLEAERHMEMEITVVTVGGQRAGALCWEDFQGADAMNHAEEADPALVLFTSGTTGRPKGVVHTQRGCWAAIRSSQRAFDFREEDVVLVTKPMTHAGGLQTQLLPALAAGATVILAHLPQPEEAVGLAQKWMVTSWALLSSQLLELVTYVEEKGLKMPSLKRVTGSGDSVPLALQQRFLKVFGFLVQEGCGITELGGYYAMQVHGSEKPGSIGVPAPGVQLRLVEDGKDVAVGCTGEVWIKSDSMTVGYWEDAAASLELYEQGWMKTGDLACQDEDGYIWFVGRRKLIIIRRGSNIAPAAVERVLATHPAVHASVVVGVPDATDGEVPVAWIVLKEKAPQADALASHVALQLASYEVPTQFLFRPSLPLNSVGKFDRARLKEEARMQLHACAGA